MILNRWMNKDISCINVIICASTLSNKNVITLKLGIVKLFIFKNFGFCLNVLCTCFDGAVWVMFASQEC
jgi:hypothetical protein